MATWRQFDNLKDLLNHFVQYVDVNYQAPMDMHPGVFEVIGFKHDKLAPTKSTVKVRSRANGVLTLNVMEHFSRFVTYR